MPLIPLLVQNAVTLAAQDRLSAFNFCNAYDVVLPVLRGSVTAESRQHLWGLSTVIPLDVVVVFGGAVNIAGYFLSGQADVTIELYDPITGAIIALSSDLCLEIGTTGVYIWSTENLAVQPVGATEYVYRMTDGAEFLGGIKEFGYLPTSDFLLEYIKAKEIIG